MIPQGKGLFIWQIKQLPGNYDAIAQAAVELGLSSVSVKVASGIGKYNLRWNGIKWVDDILLPFVQALKRVGLKVYGWHYVYGYKPELEAAVGIERVMELGLDGYEIDAEKEYKGKNSQAALYAIELNKLRPDGLHYGLTSYRYPSLHPEFPWEAMLSIADYHIPQVYWNPPRPPYHGPTSELIRSWLELTGMKDIPFYPAGRAYIGDGHPDPKPQELSDFITEAKNIGCVGCTFWAFDFLYLHAGGTARAEAIKATPWLSQNNPPQLSWEQSIDAWARTLGYRGPEPS